MRTRANDAAGNRCCAVLLNHVVHCQELRRGRRQTETGDLKGIRCRLHFPGRIVFREVLRGSTSSGTVE